MGASKTNLKVIIVGGSVSGLTLAHCFEKTGIDYVLLEAHAQIAPQIGASIALLPNGCILLDQLGLWDEIEKLVAPIVRTKYTVEGKLLGESDSLELVQTRLGYASGFLDRQVVLKILYDRLSNQNKVLVNKRTTRIEHTDSGIIVHCKDGSQYIGDIVAGADGTHSTTRSEMWRRFDLLGQSQIIAEDRTATFTDYKLLFGISDKNPGLVPGDLHRVHNIDWSAFVSAGKGDRVFWFFFEKFDKTYHAPNIPRFNQADLDSIVATFKDRIIVGETTFQDYWDSRVSYGLVALDEGWPKHWTIDRMACVGDSVHKMTVHSGQGGNNAMESAAALTNCLLDMMASCEKSKPSLEEIRHALTTYQNTRQLRAKEFCVSASHHTRLEAMKTFKDKLMARYYMPRARDAIADMITNRVTGAVVVKRLPFPARALQATVPYDTKAGVGHAENRKLRAMLALPLLGVAIYARHILSGQQSELGQLTGFQHLRLLADLVPLQVLWTIEGLRRANSMTLPSLGGPFWTGLSQLVGLSVVAPLYNFFHYVQTPQERYRAPDQRMVPTGDAKVIAPAIAIGCLAPAAVTLLPLSPSARQSALRLWQFFPIWTAAAHRLLKATVKDTTQRDRIHAPRNDLPYLRGAYLVAGCFSAALHTYLRFSSHRPWRTDLWAFGPLLTSSPVSATHFLACGSGLFWEVLHFWDLKKAKKTQIGLTKVIAGLTAITLLFGPAAALTVGWCWREEIMAASGRLSSAPQFSTTKLDA